MKKYSIKFLVALSILFVVVVFAFSFWRNNKDSDNGSDESKIQDLFTLETAINNYYETHFMPRAGSSLPASLGDLKINGLQNSIDIYKYKAIRPTPNGGPTVNYELCTNFSTASPGPKPAGTIGGTPDAYRWHKKGQQCFENSYYKSGSHIYPK
jgi:hypothetical protein